MPRLPSKPGAPVRESTTSDHVVRQASRRWVLAGLAGMTFCVAVAFSGIFRHVPPPLAATLTIACGWLMLLLMSPWRIMRSLHVDQRPLMRKVNTQLQLIAAGSRGIPLKDIIVEGDDEFSKLSRHVHDLAAFAYSTQQQARLLHKRMDQDIQRETRKATAHLEKQAATDPLTKLSNRRALEQRLPELLQGCDETGRLVTVIAIDIDRFKAVNDKLGHEAGDACLTHLADLLRTSLRRDDIAVRQGGDEFIVLMPDQSLDIGHAVATRLGKMFSQMPWTDHRCARPTLSFGVASDGIADATDLQKVLRQADAALYASKQAGRDSVTAFRRGAA